MKKIKEKKIVFPICLDLGAKTTGVYAAGYRAGTSVSDFDTPDVYKTAFIAEVDAVEGESYKLLQADRRNSRHSRHARDRNRLAKELFIALLERIYGFSASKHRIAISWFMNRRGYSYAVKKANTHSLNDLEPDLLLMVVARTDFKIQQKIDDALDGNTLDVALFLLAAERDVLVNLRGVINDLINENEDLKSKLKGIKAIVNLYLDALDNHAKHRSEYFKDVKNDLDTLHEHPELVQRNLYADLISHSLPNGSPGDKTMLDVFYLLLCHINNFDRKLLIAINKKITPSSAVVDIDNVIGEEFEKWIFKKWRTSSSNGKKKLDDIIKVRESWEARDVGAIEFLLNTDPELTIPPYESQTNRRPPACQTLVLNPDYLDEHYRKWPSWLEMLEANSGKSGDVNHYNANIAALTSNTGAPLVSPAEQKARTLQYAFDAIAEDDCFKLNKIWSKWKKLNQLQRLGESTVGVENELNRLVHLSTLPEPLQFNVDDARKTGTFWHLVFKYYQIRRRARDGRYFLHYDNTAAKSKRWVRDGKLVVMCNHKPRQLHRQAKLNVCSILGLQVDVLDEALAKHAEEDLASLFIKVFGFKSRCEESHKAQMAYQSDLKVLLSTEPKLIKLSKNLGKVLEELSVLLGLQDDLKSQFCERNNSVFIFAQLFQSIWGEQRGFSKTCPVCTTDNALRMTGIQHNATASRLSTLSMRLIDGGLKRLLTHLAHHIVNRLWPEIKRIANSSPSKSITMPIIVEQNSFDFSENLHKLKKVAPPKKKGAHKSDSILNAKMERIKANSEGMCPYLPAKELNADSKFEYDHIICRSGPYGVLNDEANLIYVSQKGNRTFKKDRMLTLDDLNPAYLKEKFGTESIKEVKNFIDNQLKSDTQYEFSFGQYHQFAALSEDDQKAFRHALFLEASHPIRDLVIKAIMHRNKTRVNGTQRYLAQLLADILTKKVKKELGSVKLDFDFIAVSSDKNNEASTTALRSLISQQVKEANIDIAPFAKEKGAPQKPYSHVIDAMMAFMIALNDHHGEGSLQIDLDGYDSVWDADLSSENKIFPLISVNSSNLSPEVVVKPKPKEVAARMLLNGKKPHEAYSARIFTQNALGFSFYDLGTINGKLYRGYIDVVDGKKTFVQEPSKSNTGIVKYEALKWAVAGGYYRTLMVDEIEVYKANKTKLMELFFDVLSRAKEKERFDASSQDVLFVTWFMNGKPTKYYYTTSTPLEHAPNVLKRPWSPYHKQWKAHYDLWKAKYPNTIEEKKGGKLEFKITSELFAAWEDHCAEFLGRNASSNSGLHNAKHCKHKEYSMRAPGCSSGCMTIVRRKSGSGKLFYEMQAIDTNALPKSLAGVLAMRSPNVVLFDGSVLKSGYQIDIKDNVNIKNTKIASHKFFAKGVLNEEQLDSLSVVAVDKTNIRISGLKRNWVMANFLNDAALKDLELLSGDGDTQLKTESICVTKLKTALRYSCRSIKKLVEEENEGGVSLVLEYRKDNILKMI